MNVICRDHLKTLVSMTIIGEFGVPSIQLGNSCDLHMQCLGAADPHLVWRHLELVYRHTLKRVAYITFATHFIS